MEEELGNGEKSTPALAVPLGVKSTVSAEELGAVREKL